VTTKSEKLTQSRQLQAAGRLDEAERLAREALAVDLTDAEAHLQLAQVLGQRGDLGGARQVLQQAARLRPADAEVARRLRHLEAVQAFQQAMVLARSQQSDSAMAQLRQAIALAPEFGEAHFTLGTMLAIAGRFDEAVGCFRRTLEIDPRKVDAHYNLALALQNQRKLAEAEPHYRRAIEIDPRHVAAWNHLATVLDGLHRRAEAEQAYLHALAIDPNFTDAEYNYSGLLLAQGRYAEAESRAGHVLSLAPDFGPAQYNYATALADQHKLAEAEAAYRKMTRLAPDYADGQLGLAGLLLSQGKFAEGWPAYEARFLHGDSSIPKIAQPRWQGEPLTRRTILLHVEQGFGDAIQFVRYAPLVKQRGGTVVVGCSPPIESLLATSPGVDFVASQYERLPPFDVWVPLASLPGVFQTTLETIPAQVPYLFPDATAVETWRSELGTGDELKIGIAWQGNRVHKRDHQRSMPLEHFAGIARTAGVRLFSLQHKDGREQIGPQTADWPLMDLGERLGDFQHVAALVRNLDLVVTCDSAPAHLAGALGVPVWIALAYTPDWRWMWDRADSPWYPSARLFRQPKPGDWASVFAEITAELARLVAARR
jgi:tetratricopeptide (TPR) repeat protein